MVAGELTDEMLSDWLHQTHGTMLLMATLLMDWRGRAQRAERVVEEKVSEAQRLASALEEANHRLAAAETELAQMRKRSGT